MRFANHPICALITAGLAAGLLLSAPAVSAPASRLKPVMVAPGKHQFITSDGKPFFWLGDTAWELIHSTTLDEANYYLTTRARQGYTVIQTVVLAEMDGIRRPTPEGLTPFIGNDPSRPNTAYFDKVEAIVERADALGLYVALLPTWGDKVTPLWGAGPVIFPTDRPDIARTYGRFLGQRLKGHDNIIWMLGGDRPPVHEDKDFRPVWAAMADGIRDGYGRDPLLAYHPMGGTTTSRDLKDATWLDINGMQSGHGGGHDVPVWETVEKDYALGRPTLDLEPNYEDHPFNPWPAWDPGSGYFNDYDVRKQIYRSVFAGAAGVTYGHHSIWQFAGSRYPLINFPAMDWMTALQRPGGRQMEYLRALIESRPMLSRIPDDSLIVAGQVEGGRHMTATRGDGYAFVYFPLNDTNAEIDVTPLKATKVRAWWYDPRTGTGRDIGVFTEKTIRVKSPPQAPDWVLVIDDDAKGFAPPGLKP